MKNRSNRIQKTEGACDFFVDMEGFFEDGRVVGRPRAGYGPTQNKV